MALDGEGDVDRRESPVTSVSIAVYDYGLTKPWNRPEHSRS
jgi:hypothetical protein